MTERSLGNSDNVFIGQVVNVFDPDKEGKYQLRVIGQHDDTINIPDNDLPWGKVIQDPTSAGQNKIGSLPVGIIKGSWVSGYWLDGDMQIAVINGTVAKAGDIASNGAVTVDGQAQLANGTNSTPIGGRVKTNAFTTRKGKSIRTDDSTKDQYPEEQKDSDGVDISAEAKANTTYGTNGTTGSIAKPSGSILSQIPTVDPNNKNAVLPNAVSAFTKMKDLSAFSSTTGVNGILGQVLGAAINAIGAGAAAEALGTALNASGLSSTSVAALQGAMSSIGSTASFSPTVSSVVTPLIAQMTNQLSSLISGGGLNNSSFNSLMSEHQSNIQNDGATATIGANMTNIMSNLGSVLPTISASINSVTGSHIPNSVLNSSVIKDALQKFAMNQAFVKAPDQGKKALAKLAVNTVSNNAATNIQNLPVTSAAANNLKVITAYNG